MNPVHRVTTSALYQVSYKGNMMLSLVLNVFRKHLSQGRVQINAAVNHDGRDLALAGGDRNHLCLPSRQENRTTAKVQDSRIVSVELNGFHAVSLS